MLWIGPVLGPVERACMRSVVEHGHALDLYCYDKPDGVPEGVEICDAVEILPAELIIRHHTGSVSLFSNRFRYELQRRVMGIWLDADIYLVRPIECGDYLLTEEEPGKLNNSVLLLPPDSPMIQPLLALFEEDFVPPWLPWRAAVAAHWRLMTRGRANLSKMPWGVAGPQALTALARKFGLNHLASPPTTFHPVHWRRADWIRDPRHGLNEMISDQTVGIHLWNEQIKAFKDETAAPGSFLARLQQEGR